MKDYYVGLDMGTDSVGWAVTDEKYQIPKFRGNSMWGIRLLEESNTSADRRLARNTRRRNQRKAFRRRCLEMIFDAEICKKDIAFFQRLKDSALYMEDKSINDCCYSVFNDENYTDKDYHKDYPTVYHLRKELIENKSEHDVRLVYLAVYHIIKNRGHFLFDSETMGDNIKPKFSQVWNELVDSINDDIDIQEFNVADTRKIEKVLKNKKLSKSKKSEELLSVFNIKKSDKQKFEILKALCGRKFDCSVIFQNEEYKETKAKSIDFTGKFDDDCAEYEFILGENYEIIERLKAVYDWSVLDEILHGNSYISFSKVEDYEKHKTDLKLLKEYVKNYVSEKYDEIFNKNDGKTNNYLMYTGHCKKLADKKCTQEDFYKFLLKVLPKKDDCPENRFLRIYEDIETLNFLPKAVSVNNSVIPMQINKKELEIILNNAKEYLPFLNKKDKNGKTAIDKIISVFSFRIPYYVGPLNKHSDKSWIERTEDKIYPWNFNDVVDVEKSAENFIMNLTSKCTYLRSEDVLPKNSLLYSSYCVLNDLNNVKVNSEKLSVEDKQEIYNSIFLHKGKVKQKDIKNYFKSKYNENVEITGIDGDFKSSLKSFLDLKNISLPESEKEKIIKDITVFGDDKKLLKKRLKKNYDRSVLSDEDINYVCKLKYKGWGRLSSKFLTGIYSVIDNDTGEALNIMNCLWQTQDNLMQILYSYQFEKIVDELNDNDFKTLKDEVESLYVSPKIRRPIYQSMKIVEEIVKINKCEPKKIFVEVARGPQDEKCRTVARKKKLIELYKSCKKEEKELYEKLNETPDSEFKRDALYLYYTQFGRCMYTGQVIPIEDIYNRNIYDIDHIFPQSKLKDDSLNNRVLVLKTENEKKGNVYPISHEIRKKMKPFWNILLQKELITKEKYERLIRNTPLSEFELGSFISRQLVETQQSTKAVAELLKKRYPNTEIVYVKAGLVSDFRHDYKFIKSRDLNDFHHAKDAYLDIVVGNVYSVKNRQNFVHDLINNSCSFRRVFDYNVKGAWVSLDEDKENSDATIKTVRKYMNKNNIRFTRYSSKKTGEFFKQQIVKKGKGQVEIKKGLEISKYGGYPKPTASYFAFVQYEDKKGKLIKSFEPVDLYLEKEYVENPIQYIQNRLPDAKNIKIIIPCIKYNTLISVNGFRMHMSQKSNGGSRIVCKPAMQLVLDTESEKYIKKISNYLRKCEELKSEKEITSFDEIYSSENEKLYMNLANKISNTILSVKFGTLGDDLSEKFDVFNALSEYQQCVVLMEILKILHANVVSGDLTLIGKSKQSGIMTISNKISAKGISSFKIIHQSITGLFENEVELL